MVGMGTAQALISTTQPQLTLNHFIRTSPFGGTSTKVSDNEGSTYVASDDALWMADDNGDALWEVDRTTGALRRKLAQSAFINAPRFGVGGTAGQSRTEDLEALAYDANADIIYAFSGSTSATPTVYRLTRDAGHQFQVESWQPLPSEWTGAGWRSADGLTYVVNGSTIRTYDFATNTFGPSFSISGLSKVYGIDFDDATGDLLAVNSSQRLYRASMSTRTLLPGWTGISLTGFGLLDTRAVEVIGEQVFVTDGADSSKRSSSSPMFHAVFVLDVSGPGGPGPTAGFIATPTSGAAPLTVNFTDTSSGSPTSWAWNFGDGGILLGLALAHVQQHRDLHRDLDRKQHAGIQFGLPHHHCQPAVGPDRELHGDADQRRGTAHGELHRHEQRLADELGLELRGRRHFFLGLALAHVRDHRDLHRDVDRHQRPRVQLGLAHDHRHAHRRHLPLRRHPDQPVGHARAGVCAELQRGRLTGERRPAQVQRRRRRPDHGRQAPPVLRGPLLRRRYLLRGRRDQPPLERGNGDVGDLPGRRRELRIPGRGPGRVLVRDRPHGPRDGERDLHPQDQEHIDQRRRLLHEGRGGWNRSPARGDDRLIRLDVRTTSGCAATGGPAPRSRRLLSMML